MKLTEVLRILGKIKKIHEMNPDLYMSDATNKEIIEALDMSMEGIRFLGRLAEGIVSGQK